MAERLQKLIAQAGIASRRTAEALILDGRVRVNGHITRELGAKADLHHDRVEVDGKRLVAERLVYYVLHKPRGVMTTLDDPEGRDTIADLLRGIPERVFPVGRLDYHTSGALLITNDGELAQALLHPRKQVPKQYIAKVKGQLEVRELDALRKGVVLDDGYRTKPAELFVLREEGSNSWIHITIGEGKNRQVHRMFMALGRPVMRLSRVSFAGLSTDGLRPGDYRELYTNEVEKLQKDYVLGAAPPVPAPKAKAKPRRKPTPKRTAQPKPRTHSAGDTATGAAARNPRVAKARSGPKSKPTERPSVDGAVRKPAVRGRGKTSTPHKRARPSRKS